MRDEKRRISKKPGAYPVRYVEDFFSVSNEVAIKPSQRS
jgi:hypothetical protein